MTNLASVSSSTLSTGLSANLHTPPVPSVAAVDRMASDLSNQLTTQPPLLASHANLMQVENFARQNNRNGVDSLLRGRTPEEYWNMHQPLSNPKPMPANWPYGQV